MLRVAIVVGVDMRVCISCDNRTADYSTSYSFSDLVQMINTPVSLNDLLVRFNLLRSQYRVLRIHRKFVMASSV